MVVRDNTGVVEKSLTCKNNSSRGYLGGEMVDTRGLKIPWTARSVRVRVSFEVQIWRKPP